METTIEQSAPGVNLMEREMKVHRDKDHDKTECTVVKTTIEREKEVHQM